MYSGWQGQACCNTALWDTMVSTPPLTFSLSTVFVHHFAAVHCAQEHNRYSFFSDIADDGVAAIKSKLCAGNLPGFGSLHERSDVCRGGPGIGRSFSRRHTCEHCTNAGQYFLPDSLEFLPLLASRLSYSIYCIFSQTQNIFRPYLVDMFGMYCRNFHLPLNIS
ncbi:hypothetical protein GOODEAATRI_015993 [Goodea atripinnis]|uniref:Uncharacterized protein n=1 Tax=Goodea atripinnis TaxID=208336 RepID=A0ABV0PYX7_9TELE